VKIADEIKLGDEVVIKEGPLKDLTGIFEGRMKDSERVMVLLDVVSYQARVQLNTNALKKACH
jgi:transcription antitermination factor NusG